MDKALARVGVVVVLLTGCRSGGLSVQTYWGTTTQRLAAGSVYDWWLAADTTSDGGQSDERLVAVVRQATETQLSRLGFQKRSGEAQPDFLVSVHMGRGFQPSPRGPEDRATLAIEIHAAADGHLIYLGSADAAVDPTLTPEQRTARIERAVREILEPFAPR